MDVKYVDHITFLGDLKIIWDSVMAAFVRRDGISSETSVTMEEFMGNGWWQSEAACDPRRRRPRQSRRGYRRKNRLRQHCVSGRHEKNVRTLSRDGESARFSEYDCDFFVAIGNPQVRRRMQEMLLTAGKQVTTLIHPSAVIGEDVTPAPAHWLRRGGHQPRRGHRRWVHHQHLRVR